MYLNLTEATLKRMINKDLFLKIKQDTKLFNSPIHGIQHWKTVEANGHYLSKFNCADKDVISYFAYLHDCMRVNEDEDLKHGPRAAMYAQENRHLIDLDDDQFQELFTACKGHTFGRVHDNETVKTCWDSDRLDLGRVGIIPDSQYLFTVEAKRIADEIDFDVLCFA